MPPLVEPIESEPPAAPIRVMAAIVVTGDRLELRPLQRCTAEEIAVIERVELVPWLCVEPAATQQ